MLALAGMLSFRSPEAQVRTNQLVLDEDPRGEPELVLCSQNLANYGTLASVRERVANATQEMLNEKEAALVKRFADTRCDVIAVQELLGKEDEIAQATLRHLALLLQRRVNRFFETQVGASEGGKLHVGFLVARDRAEILNHLSYAKVELPKLNPKQRPRYFSHGPLEIQIEVKPRGESIRKTLSIVTFHLKSRAGGSGDPAGLEWETYRMEEAEALRRILENRHARAFASSETLFAALGDRNSHFDIASAKILEGTLALRNFMDKAPCRLSKRGVPLCIAGTAMPQRLFSVLLLDPHSKARPGTFEHKGVYSWLDDILMPQESLRYAAVSADTVPDYDSGVVYEPQKASDHALVYVKLNW